MSTQDNTPQESPKQEQKPEAVKPKVDVSKLECPFKNDENKKAFEFKGRINSIAILKLLKMKGDADDGLAKKIRRNLRKAGIYIGKEKAGGSTELVAVEVNK